MREHEYSRGALRPQRALRPSFNAVKNPCGPGMPPEGRIAGDVGRLRPLVPPLVRAL